MRAYDAVVIGAGINGLTCAAYLARAGLRTLVLEARVQTGGMATLALTADRLSGAVVRDLGLRRHGLRLVAPAVSFFAPQPDGGALTLWRDAPRTIRELADNPLVGHRDAERYAAADERLRVLAGRLGRLLARPPGGAEPLGALQALTELPMSVRDLVEEWFESDALRALLEARAILYSGLEPRAPGTAALLITDAAYAGGGIAGQAVVARGGPRAVTGALTAALHEKGGDVRAAARVARVRRQAERTLGVTLESGEEIDAPLVVSSLDPRTTLLDLLEPEALGPRLSWRASNIRQQGVMAHVTFALGGPPIFPSANGDARRLAGRIILAPSRRYLDLAMRPARHATTADAPLIVATMPEAHRLDALVQAVAPDADADEVRRAAVAAIEAFAPGFSGLIESAEVVAPLDLEREFGARGGHPLHAEAALDQWFAWRPLHGFGRYRMPLEGFYLAGAGAHPGGGVTGRPGRLAARTILADARRGRLRLSP